MTGDGREGTWETCDLCGESLEPVWSHKAKAESIGYFIIRDFIDLGVGRATVYIIELNVFISQVNICLDMLGGPEKGPLFEVGDH